jgi:hypothetical protein
MATKRILLFLIHALCGWALCGAVMGFGMQILPLRAALLVHLAAAPLIFHFLSHSYHRRVPHADALKSAAAFTLFVIALDAGIVALLIQRSFVMFKSVLGTWLPFCLIFLSALWTGKRIRKQ